MTIREIPKEFFEAAQFVNRSEWMKWLQKNHRTAQKIWLVIFKKNSKEIGLRYKEAVEEALCFGWIDSKMKSIDKNYFIQNFTPRKKIAFGQNQISNV
ncbi:MAG: hypothetical protein JW866_00215 [Ignavibacteriales bacterium]|nr:hypothetical protein [Ignavibacteriales bacterium]